MDRSNGNSLGIKQLAETMRLTLKSALVPATMWRYLRRFEKYAYTDLRCNTPEQFEASIVRLYHTVEKGLSYEDYRAGFGERNIDALIVSLEQYASRGYDTSAFFYETALSCLHAYVEKNRQFGHVDEVLERRIEGLPGSSNGRGGTLAVSAPINPGTMSYEELVKSRHSLRKFSGKPVDVELLVDAIRLAQYTPSACNRQGWKTRIVTDRQKIDVILSNQNGNRGFGQGIDKFLVITSDLCAQQRSRELFQAFIDGGMYAESVLNSLYAKGVASIPLSASLSAAQESNVKRALGIPDSEVLILFVGVGSYPDEPTLTTRSERKPIEVQII